MMAEYDEEQSDLEQEAEKLERMIATQTQDFDSPKKFVDLVKRYSGFTELTTPMLNEFVEKLVVHEATGGRSNRQQKVDIYFNFIGEFTPLPQMMQANSVSTHYSCPHQKSAGVAVNTCCHNSA